MDCVNALELQNYSLSLVSPPQFYVWCPFLLFVCWQLWAEIFMNSLLCRVKICVHHTWFICNEWFTELVILSYIACWLFRGLLNNQHNPQPLRLTTFQNKSSVNSAWLQQQNKRCAFTLNTTRRKVDWKKIGRLEVLCVQMVPKSALHFPGPSRCQMFVE